MDFCQLVELFHRGDGHAFPGPDLEESDSEWFGNRHRRWGGGVHFPAGMHCRDCRGAVRIKSTSRLFQKHVHADRCRGGGAAAVSHSDRLFIAGSHGLPVRTLPFSLCGAYASALEANTPLWPDSTSGARLPNYRRCIKVFAVPGLHHRATVQHDALHHRTRDERRLHVYGHVGVHRNCDDRGLWRYHTGDWGGESVDGRALLFQLPLHGYANLGLGQCNEPRLDGQESDFAYGANTAEAEAPWLQCRRLAQAFPAVRWK
mmetsp:Transcript_67130/g.157471  ORF Transcript_67130/g.157471 Transcript_67130/m.157471 type:complete len:260 (-) Transcript_67130:287-1066(-)